MIENKEDPALIIPLLSLYLKHVGGQRNTIIDKASFNSFGELNGGFYNSRLFDLVDKDHDGSIQFKDLLNFVLEFKGKREAGKIEFLFALYDKNGDGIIDKEEIEEMLNGSLAYGGLTLDSDQIAGLAKTLLENGTGSTLMNEKALTKENFAELFTSYPDLLENLSTVIERWLHPTNGKINKRYRPRMSLKIKLHHFWMFIFILLNFALFTLTFWMNNELQLFLRLARAMGRCVSVNMVFVVVTMLQKSLKLLRSLNANRIFPIDHNRLFHKVAGVYTIGFGVVHGVMHIINVCMVYLPGDDGFNKGNYTIWELFFLPSASNGEVPQGTPKFGFPLLPGYAYITGFLIVFFIIILVLGVLPATKKCYPVFYWTHFICYMALFVLLILHSRLFWAFIIGPLGVFIVEKVIFRISDTIRGKNSTYIVQASILPNKVLELVLNRPKNFHFNAGDYVSICIKQISSAEWHPFTISSAPENQDRFTLHIKVEGYWTRKLYNIFHFIHQKHSLVISNPIRSIEINNHDNNDEDLEQSIPLIDFGSSLKMNYGYGSINSNAPLAVASTSRASIQQDHGHTNSVGLKTASHSKPRTLRFFHSMDSLSKKPKNSYNLIMEDDEDDTGSVSDIKINRLVKVQLDGPFGAPSSHIFEAEHAVIIGSGIGVTPFASILQSISYRHQASKITCPHCHRDSIHYMEEKLDKLQKVDFFWLSPDQTSFQWFVNLLSKLEIEQKEREIQDEKKGIIPRPRFLDTHLYMTRGVGLISNDMKAVGLRLAIDIWNQKGNRDLITGLKTRTHGGRPNWRRVFQQLASQKRGKVTVFVCGNSQLQNELRAVSSQFGFGFKVEVF